MNRIGSSMQNKNSISLVKSQLSIKITKNLNNFYFHKKLAKNYLFHKMDFLLAKQRNVFKP